MSDIDHNFYEKLISKIQYFYDISDELYSVEECQEAFECLFKEILYTNNGE